MMENGDTKRGAGRTISLIRDTPALQAAMDSTCARYRTSWGALRDSLGRVHKALADSGDVANRAMMDRIGDRAARDRWDDLATRNIAYFDTVTRYRVASQAAMAVVMRNVIRSETIDTVGAGMNAHFSFPKVAAGRYVLFGEWTIGDNDYQWWAPITVLSGKPLRRDLGNSVEADDKIFCGVH